MRVAYTPYPADVFLAACFKDGHVETVAYAVSCACYTRDAPANDGDFGAVKTSAWRGGVGRKDLVYQPLQDLV